MNVRSAWQNLSPEKRRWLVRHIALVAVLAIEGYITALLVLAL